MKHLLLLTALFSSLISFSQPKKKDKLKQIKISGIISDTSLLDSANPEIFFYDTYNPDRVNNAEVIPLHIVNNKFNITIKTDNEVGYFLFESHMIPGLFQNLFLVTPGDSICINIKSGNNVYFTGKGAEKMNYQHWVGEQLIRNIQKVSSINDTSRIYVNKQNVSKLLSASLDSLDALKGFMNQKIYNLLKVNTVAAIKDFYISQIGNFRSTNDSVYLSVMQKELVALCNEQRIFTVTDPFIIQNSFVYQEYLFELVRSYTTLVNKAKKANFKLIYSFINNNFSGMLRDKLIVNDFLYFVQKETDVVNYLSQTIPSIEDKDSKIILTQMITARKPGVKAFDFSFEDIKGQRLKLQDFKGKLVVMDTWFLGCPGCLALAQLMKPVIEHFRNNKNIVFLAVNVDKDKNRFIKGVKSGKYTSDITVNVYTNGLGEFHPMLKFYQYRGYPNLLLIDKNGFVISSNPSWPRNEETKKELIELIERNL